MIGRAFLFLAALLGVLALIWALSPPAKSHEWYDGACCDATDCHPVPATSIKATPSGWLIVPTGETIPYGDPKERWSKDSGFHVCTIPTTPGTIQFSTAGKTRCLYVPPGGV